MDVEIPVEEIQWANPPYNSVNDILSCCSEPVLELEDTNLTEDNKLELDGHCKSCDASITIYSALMATGISTTFK